MDTQQRPPQREFAVGVEKLLGRCKKTLLAKEKEYASEGDRYHNFRRAAEVLGCSAEKALLGMKAKHTVSISDIVEQIDVGVYPDPDVWNEKIGDEINYLILLDGLVKENLLKGGGGESLGLWCEKGNAKGER